MAQWLDDLGVRVDQFRETELGQSIGDYLNARVVDAVVQIAPPKTGNLSAEQIAAGQRGGTAATAAPQSGVAVVMANPVMKYLPYVAVGVAAYLLLKKKSRR